MLVRQVRGSIAQFDKASLVAKMKAARDRKRAETGMKVGGRRSYSEDRPEVVKLGSQAGLSPPPQGRAALASGNIDRSRRCGTHEQQRLAVYCYVSAADAFAVKSPVNAPA